VFELFEELEIKKNASFNERMICTILRANQVKFLALESYQVMMIELKELNKKVSVISACKKDVDKTELKRKKVGVVNY
ncbi:43856_t:CDS:2, partial [Gigaspora margarita]